MEDLTLLPHQQNDAAFSFTSVIPYFIWEHRTWPLLTKLPSLTTIFFTLIETYSLLLAFKNMLERFDHCNSLATKKIQITRQFLFQTSINNLAALVLILNPVGANSEDRYLCLSFRTEYLLSSTNC